MRITHIPGIYAVVLLDKEPSICLANRSWNFACCPRYAFSQLDSGIVAKTWGKEKQRLIKLMKSNLPCYE